MDRKKNMGSEASLSIADLFSIGIGPSSSHTVGPMRAGYQFVQKLKNNGLLHDVYKIQITLYGSLALTGKGHGTDKAMLLGLSGYRPSLIDADKIEPIIHDIVTRNKMLVNQEWEIDFNPDENLVFHFEPARLKHPNTLRIEALGSADTLLMGSEYYSVGGGFIVEKGAHNSAEYSKDQVQLKYSFESAEELLKIASDNDLSIAELMLENERAWRSEDETKGLISRIIAAMFSSIDRGCIQTGYLPGPFKVRRRANALFESLKQKDSAQSADPLMGLDWVNLYALAVSEENASGSRVVTAPTNGAAGIIPAVLKYFDQFFGHEDQAALERFLLTAGAIGVLYKKRASISGAEVGCQGEVGVACSMAAAGLVAAFGGSNQQIENAAEIGMEHNLGLTCDPVGGLVQVPCIERNTMGAVKAINAARLAMMGDGTHLVSLDKVIETMRQTGQDMKSKYKETSKGGLAVNVVSC